MRFLINCSNLKSGGGLQVADSICCLLKHYPEHHFVVVLSKYLVYIRKNIHNATNIEMYPYDIPDSFKTIVIGRDSFLDLLVKDNKIDAVLTVFGPSRWRPRVPHLSGFAFSQMVMPESPYFLRMSNVERVKLWLWCRIRQWSFKRSADSFWTENTLISERLGRLLHTNHIYTVTNYYNQVFDYPNQWKRSIKLPAFDGITCLSVSSPMEHKNFGIIVDVVRIFAAKHPEMRIRFILTFDENDMSVPDDVKDHVIFAGKTDVSECPYLYEQADIMFMPTLLECFTATYPEAMRMEVPIVTTDLEFARGLCGDAACYYNAIDAQSAADAIYKVATDIEYARLLVKNGKKQLLTYDNYEQRTDKLIRLLEQLRTRKDQKSLCST